MKKTLVVLSLLCLLSVRALASAVDWSVSFSTTSEFGAAWGNATVYSYLTLSTGSPLGSSVEALSPESFMATWSTSTAATETTMAGLPKPLDDGSVTGAVGGWTQSDIDGPRAGYLIVVLVKEDGSACYSFAGNPLGYGEGALTPRADDAGASNVYSFDENSTWVTVGNTPVDPGAPEPTVLALLALGVAGLALKRRVA